MDGRCSHWRYWGLARSCTNSSSAVSLSRSPHPASRRKGLGGSTSMAGPGLGPVLRTACGNFLGFLGNFGFREKIDRERNSVRNKMESLLFPQHPFSRSAQNRPSPGIRERRRYRSFYQRSASDRGRERTHSHRKRGAQVPTPTSTPRPIETTTSTQHHPARWFQA